jgi:DeoR family glycerol-3-phosphate regulon repressor
MERFMIQRNRHDAIIALVRRQGYASIEQLAGDFGVTPQTIRRDLNLLANEGRLRRVHGGAGLESSTVNTAYQTRKTLNVAAILQHQEDFNVIVAGGQVRSRDGGIIGEATIDFINQFKVDYGIIGISGIDDDGSLLEFDYQEVRVAQAIIHNSRQVMLLADHSKFHRNAVVRQGNIAQIDALFTDRQPPERLLQLIEAHDVALHIAEEPATAGSLEDDTGPAQQSR